MRGAIGAPLALDAARRLRPCLQPFRRDLAAAVDAPTVRTVLDASERFFDRAQIAPERELFRDELLPRVEVRRDVGRMLRGGRVLALRVEISREHLLVTGELGGGVGAELDESLLHVEHERERRSRARRGEVPLGPDRPGRWTLAVSGPARYRRIRIDGRCRMSQLSTIRDDDDLEIPVDVDPVCGATVEIEQATLRDEALEYEGHDYVFCGAACRDRFEQDPRLYSAAGRAEP